MKQPRIADVRCERLRFEPGDRILVRVHHRLDADARKKLTATIRSWAGCEVEVLVYCSLDMEINVEKRRRFRPLS